MRKLLDRFMLLLGYRPTSADVKHFGPHQRTDIHTPIDCETAQKLLTGRSDPSPKGIMLRESLAAAAGRKLPRIYQLLTAVYEGDEEMQHEIWRSALHLPTIYWEGGTTVTVQLTSNIEVRFDTAYSDSEGHLAAVRDQVTVARRDNGESINFLLGGNGAFTFVMDDIPDKLRALLLGNSV